MRQKASGTKIISEFRQVKTAFNLLAASQGRTTLWGTAYNSSDFASPENCPGASGAGNVWHGVAISIREVPQNSGVVERIDKKIDGGDGAGCGRIKWNQSGGEPVWSLYWMIAPSRYNL